MYIHNEKGLELIKNNYKFKISIIMAVYNTGKYLRDAIESIVNQSIGFEKNVQLVLIDDGSIDNSNEICYEYYEKFPNNIIYISQKNYGVSHARNRGLDLAQGKIINFLDSDDKLGLTTLKNVDIYLSVNADVDVVSIRLNLFDGGKGEHPLNWKFDSKKNKTVNLDEDYSAVQMNVSSVFFKKSAIKKLRFDTDLKFSEDSKFFFDFIKNKPVLGLLSYANGCYWYRKRQGETSTMDSTLMTKSFYIETIKKFHMYLIDNYELGEIPKYVQMMLMYDLQWRVAIAPNRLVILSKSEKKQYFKMIADVLRYIDEEIIMNEKIKNISIIGKVGLIKLKNQNAQLYVKKENEAAEMYVKDYFVKDVSKMYLQMETLYVKKNKMHVSVSLPSFDNEVNIKPVILINGKEIILASQSSNITKQYILGEWTSSNIYYRFDFSINADMKQVEFKFQLKNNALIDINTISFPKKTNFRKESNRLLYRQGKLDVEFSKVKGIKIEKRTIKSVIKEFKFIGRLLKNKKTRNIGIYRSYGIIHNMIDKNETWLFLDRVNMGSDNAEALFRYTVRNHPEIKAYFLIMRGNEFERLSKEFPGKIIEYHSKTHHRLIVKTDKFFSSHAEESLFNPFWKNNKEYIKDILKYEFIFLQHGVMQNDLSSWLCKKNKPLIDKFIVTSKLERDSILRDYGYLENEVILTGLSRYDNFNKEKNRKSKKIIALMPTWRSNLANLKKTKAELVDSEYYKFINGFMKNRKVNDFLQGNGIEVQLIQHPRMLSIFEGVFENSNNVKIVKEFTYKEIIAKADAVITDVSSVAFDFAYQHKPVIYAHFDIDELYTHATYDRGYFDYKNNGFGEVIETINELYKEIQKCNENNFKMNNKYQKRSDDFFEYIDHSNCLRILTNVYKTK